MMYRMVGRLLSGKFDRCSKYKLKQRLDGTVSSHRVRFRVLLLVFTIGTVHSRKEPVAETLGAAEIAKPGRVRRLCK